MYKWSGSDDVVGAGTRSASAVGAEALAMHDLAVLPRDDHRVALDATVPELLTRP